MGIMDREKVIKGLKCCIHTDGIECPNCPYRQDDDCVETLIADVLALLKEQEPVPLIHSAGYEEYWDVENICPKCNTHWISLAEDHFCPQCGQAVKDDA